jgi:hypothetical protein
MKIDKLITDHDMENLKNTFITRKQINTIITKDATVYTKEGKLLFLFRKKKINHGQEFYDLVAPFIKQNQSTNRGSASGSQDYNVKENPKIKTAIIGYFDRWSPQHKFLFKKKGVKIPLEVRETMFISRYPEKFKHMVPFIKQVDTLYKHYLPSYYKHQQDKAKETLFKISDTSFTTVTVNINFQTTIHKDVGDDIDGFGNLTVIEKGYYTGGETCFPQYGIGVDVREGDILFMDVHQWHANLPIQVTDDAERMSVVCYLRKKIWERTKHKSHAFMKRHNKTVRNIRN